MGRLLMIVDFSGSCRMIEVLNSKQSCASLGALNLSRRRLARIRCLKECMECFKQNKGLPESLCYIPANVEYKVRFTLKPKVITLFSHPDKNGTKLKDIIWKKSQCILASGEEFCNSQGQWSRLKKDAETEGLDSIPEDTDVWILAYDSQSSCDELPVLIPTVPEEKVKDKELLFGRSSEPINCWEEVVEHHYSLHLASSPEVALADQEAISRLRELPRNWSADHDEDLAQFLCQHIETDNESLGSIKNYVESIDVSTFSEEDEGPENLTDGDPETYWESDGNQGQHWIRLNMKKGTVIKKLMLTIDGNDDNYMPSRIIVMGGEINDLKSLNDVSIDLSLDSVTDILVLENQKEHYPVLEIKIKECKDEGIDTRVRALKIKSSKERDLGLNRDLFTVANLVRFPKLEGYDADILYRRAILLQRFLSLLDSVLPYFVPSWEYSTGSFTSLEIVKQLLPLSKRRMSLVEKFLKESESFHMVSPKKLYINRRAAADHRADPTIDPECKNSVCIQVYEGLKPRDRTERPLDYRWSARQDQWWECKFVGEGIIDQGGGFRDSLSDVADELCPSSQDVPVPLPFFIRSPNQKMADSNINRDVYIPNPSCKEFTKYEWLGKLMGACLRGKENLVISLPGFIWKKMAGERVSWSRDYSTVDEAQVRMIENMDAMDEAAFEAYFGQERTWTTVLSDENSVPLKPDGAECLVDYEDRHEYSKLVQESRMKECNEQVEALKRGLLMVVPQAVLDLLTWQELEHRICGDPEISIEALKRATHYEDLEEDNTRVKHMWEALTAFSVEDRSRFLRFVTGRRRLPAPLYICPDKGEVVNALPESSTCSNTLYLPSYSTAEVAKEKLRYAAYNCIAIDTDMSPWDEWGVE